MDQYEERYRTLYRRLKAEALDRLSEMDLDRSEARELRSRIRTLPHPDVASTWDVREVYEEITSGELERIADAVGEDADELLQQIEELTPPESISEGQTQSVERSDAVHEQLQELGNRLAFQTSLLRDVSAAQSSMQAQLDVTLKGVCQSCGGDYRVTVDTSRTPPELRIECRSGSCSNRSGWAVDSIT